MEKPTIKEASEHLCTSDFIEYCEKRVSDLEQELENYRSIAEQTNAKIAVSERDQWRDVAGELYDIVILEEGGCDEYTVSMAIDKYNQLAALQKKP